MKFLPCKILDRKWAEKLLNGEVFMRPLSEFGSWNTDSDITDANRRDNIDGVIVYYTNVNEASFLWDFDPAFNEVISRAEVIEDSELSYFKLFHMYCEEGDEKNNPILPAPRIRGFGDTTIVFRDFNTSLTR